MSNLPAMPGKIEYAIVHIDLRHHMLTDGSRNVFATYAKERKGMANNLV